MNQDSSSTRGEPSGGDSRYGTAMAQVQQALRGLRFGSITLTIQDGVVVQVERTEKFRFKRSGGETFDSP